MKPCHYHLPIFLSIVLIIVNQFAYSQNENIDDVIPNSQAEINGTSDSTWIVDGTGKRWDVAYAIEVLNWSTNNFAFGLGPYWFSPITNPDFIEMGHPNFPSPDQSFEVIGITVNGESRAYPTSALIGHEVINDTIGSNFIAVTY